MAKPASTRSGSSAVPAPVAGGARSAGSPARQQRDLIGQTIGGKYYVHSVLGEGGMGTVFEAKNTALGRAVAVKVLHPSQAKKKVAVKRFHQEARAAGAIGHPNICEVYDLGTLDDGSPYLVMEKLVGQTLADRITQEGALPFDEVVDILSQVLSGLVAAHDKGIVHRDIKPENVFLTDRVGIPPVAKLLDFGVSKMLFPAPGERPEDLDLTRTGMVMGTPFYMSPEQARGDRNLDARVDLWACGVLMYEALTAKRPFHAANYNALLLQILSSKPRPARELRPSIPIGFDRIFTRAMARNRDERYSSATEFQRDLGALRAELVGSSTQAYVDRMRAPLPPPSAAKSSPSARRGLDSRSGVGTESKPSRSPPSVQTGRSQNPRSSERPDPLARLPRLGSERGSERDSGTDYALHSSHLDSNEVDQLLEATPLPTEGFDDVPTEISSQDDPWAGKAGTLLPDDDATVRSKPNHHVSGHKRKPPIPDIEQTVKVDGDPSDHFRGSRPNPGTPTVPGNPKGRRR